MMLNRTDLVQQAERVQSVGQRPQTVRGGNRVRGEQPRTPRRQRVVRLVDAEADPRLLGELERRLEHVHEQVPSTGGPVGISISCSRNRA